MTLQVFDKHNRGYICASDLRAVLQCLGEDLSEEESKYKIKLLLRHTIARNNDFFILFTQVEDMIKEVDVDGDGRIDFYGKCEHQPFRLLISKLPIRNF